MCCLETCLRDDCHLQMESLKENSTNLLGWMTKTTKLRAYKKGVSQAGEVPYP